MCSLRAVALLFVVLAGVALSTCAAYEKNHMKRLLDALLNVNYSVLARPVRSTSNTTRVTMSMSLNQILELNPKYQILTINAFLSLKWEDHFLVWNPDHYGGIQVVYLRSVDIWRPDILLSNRPVLPVSWSGRRRLNRHLTNPHWLAWRGRPINTSMKSTKKPRPPVPSSIDVSDLGGDSGSRIHAGGAKNPWVKKNHQRKEEKKKKHQQKEILKIAMYDVRTLSQDEHVRELEEELKETNIK
ncbi:hypothetical protein LSAT2_026534 [Lamellibrachia satsuma]|nr:hypothetical protein LSAT2_026534 [Lamellibrachia satsuma]